MYVCCHIYIFVRKKCLNEQLIFHFFLTYKYSKQPQLYEPRDMFLQSSEMAL